MSYWYGTSTRLITGKAVILHAEHAQRGGRGTAQSMLGPRARTGWMVSIFAKGQSSSGMTPNTRCTEGRVGLRAGLDWSRNSHLPLGFEPSLSSLQQVNTLTTLPLIMLPIAKIVVVADEWSTDNWWNYINRQQPMSSEKNLSQSHLVHQNTLVDWHRIKPRPPH